MNRELYDLQEETFNIIWGSLSDKLKSAIEAKKGNKEYIYMSTTCFVNSVISSGPYEDKNDTGFLQSIYSSETGLNIKRSVFEKICNNVNTYRQHALSSGEIL